MHPALGNQPPYFTASTSSALSSQLWQDSQVRDGLETNCCARMLTTALQPGFLCTVHAVVSKQGAFGTPCTHVTLRMCLLMGCVCWRADSRHTLWCCGSWRQPDARTSWDAAAPECVCTPSGVPAEPHLHADARHGQQLLTPAVPVSAHTQHPSRQAPSPLGRSQSCSCLSLVSSVLLSRARTHARTHVRTHTLEQISSQQLLHGC